jgi:NAD(P)-dependent dehydrogenase (short-subunit alcohol dehydrogenase family)
MKLTGKKALITGGNSGIVWPQPVFSLRRVRRSPLPVAIRRRSMKRSPNLDRTHAATAQTLPLRKTAGGSSQP